MRALILSIIYRHLKMYSVAGYLKNVNYGCFMHYVKGVKIMRKNKNMRALYIVKQNGTLHINKTEINIKYKIYHKISKMKRIKYIVFDLDGVLAPIGGPITDKTRNELKKIQKMVKIIIASGKNIDYLMGFSRGLGIKPIALIGENGARIFICRGSKEIIFSNKKIINKIKMDVLKKYKNIWSPNNKIQFSVYAKKSNLNNIFDYIIKKYKKYIDKSIKLIIHSDAIDLLPKEIDKGNAIKRLKEYLNLDGKEIISVGDSEMDLTMAKETKYFIYLGEEKYDINNIIYVNDSYQMFKMIKKLIGETNHEN